MAVMEKIAVTLPKADVRRLRQVETARKLPFSAVVREAVETWLRIQDDAVLREQYRRYYAAPSVTAREQALARQMANSSGRGWPAD